MLKKPGSLQTADEKKGRRKKQKRNIQSIVVDIADRAFDTCLYGYEYGDRVLSRQAVQYKVYHTDIYGDWISRVDQKYACFDGEIQTRTDEQGRGAKEQQKP